MHHTHDIYIYWFFFNFIIYVEDDIIYIISILIIIICYCCYYVTTATIYTSCDDDGKNFSDCSCCAKKWHLKLLTHKIRLLKLGFLLLLRLAGVILLHLLLQNFTTQIIMIFLKRVWSRIYFSDYVQFSELTHINNWKTHFFKFPLATVNFKSHIYGGWPAIWDVIIFRVLLTTTIY